MDLTVDGTECYEAAGVFHHNSGKSELSAFWVTAHATGRYPDWWQGKRFDRPTWGYAAAPSWEGVGKGLQFKLLGVTSREDGTDSGEIGTGMIPGDDIVAFGPKVSNTNVFSYVDVRHVSGGISRIEFQAFSQGREAFQATERDYAACDEEDKRLGATIFAEIVQRFRGKSAGGVYLHTMTPLYGWTELATMFVFGMNPTISNEEFEKSGRACVFISQDDVPHMTSEEIEQRLLNELPHMREARRTGMPSMGSGNVYQVQTAEFTVPTRAIPNGWRKVWIMDPGYQDPTAVIWAGIDPETGQIELYSEHYVTRTEPAVHAVAIKARGGWIPGLSDTNANNTSAQMGATTLMMDYQALGLLIEPIAKPAIAESIQLVNQALSTGILKVQQHLKWWFHEYRLYRFDEHGKIVQGNDHLMDCTRYLIAGGGIAAARSAPLPSAPKVNEQRFC